MVRLTRAQQQERTRTAVLVAAEAEFAEHGFIAAKVDRIAERAELTRGAVYSNFPSKRALYLAVLVDTVEREANDAVPPTFPRAMADALGSFARTWLERLPLADGTGTDVHPRSLAAVVDDAPTRNALARIDRLEVLLFALALESCPSVDAERTRQVRRADLVLRLLKGSGPLADPMLGSDPFDVTHACRHLGGLDLADVWDPPHLPHIAAAHSCREPWTAPGELPDLITGHPVGFEGDGVIAVLGTDRLGAAEEVVRAARPGDRVTVAVVTSDPAEIGRLVRLRIVDFTRCLRRVFSPDAVSRLRLVLDDGALLASAIGVADAADDTEQAVRIDRGEIVARARGRGAAHAAASARASATTRPPGGTP
ncbi:helix-turn-helix domain-containing protein [Streptomyces sp. NPDC005963]|uniref:TetR/AcrR family transcriptional regulator n=1 Tax=Streptomyces sp. NPDC005963 TaxID=3156721 RepID=UPI0033DE54D5